MAGTDYGESVLKTKTPNQTIRINFFLNSFILKAREVKLTLNQGHPEPKIITMALNILMDGHIKVKTLETLYLLQKNI